MKSKRKKNYINIKIKEFTPFFGRLISGEDVRNKRCYCNPFVRKENFYEILTGIEKSKGGRR